MDREIKEREAGANGKSKAPDISNVAALRELLESHRGERHVVVLQSFPDPDAIASGYAHSLICDEYDIPVDIIYAGKISHQQNIAMVRLLGIEMKLFDANLDLQKYDGAVFVDNQGTTSLEIVESLEEHNIPVLAIIDHHEYQERLVPVFADIRRSAGATATIYTEYMRDDHLIELNKSRRDHVLLATALFHGIMTDTANFIRASEPDFAAVGFLTHYRDADLLEQIMSQARSRQTMNIIRKALGERTVIENFSLAGIGYIRSEDRDAIPQAADFLLTEENVHTAIVFGIVTGEEREERIIGSMRTTKITLDPDQFIKDAFGRNVNGVFFGGGKTNAGGFEIPIGFLSGGEDDGYRELKWQVYDTQIKQKIFAKIGTDPNPKEA